MKVKRLPHFKYKKATELQAGDLFRYAGSQSGDIYIVVEVGRNKYSANSQNGFCTELGNSDIVPVDATLVEGYKDV